jgi:hypothetical protein
MTTTIARPADRLRAALKAAGFNARHVSVRHDHSTLRVTIRDASVSLTQVEAIAGPFESVRRCEATGEILLGGNCYVDCRYDPDLVKPLKAELASLLASAPFDAYVPVRGAFRALKIAGPREEVRLEGPGIEDRNAIAYGTVWAAERIAIAYLDAQARSEVTADDTRAGDAQARAPGEALAGAPARSEGCS